MSQDHHWVNGHGAYEDPDSSLSRRLAVVQRRLDQLLSEAPDGPLRLLSLCAGQGRDVIDVLARHRRGRNVSALLVEFDRELGDDARERVRRAGLERVGVRVGDASVTTTFESGVPTDVLVACGIVGNISDVDIHHTVTLLPTLLAPGGAVVWTRHHRSPDLTPSVRTWFRECGFDEVAFDTEENSLFGVGTHRLVTAPQPFESGRRLFTFVGNGSAARW